MTKLTEFKLKFDTDREFFKPGDEIPCKIILTLDGQMETKGIKIVSQGKWINLNYFMTKYIYHIETSQLIGFANQWTGFYMVETSVMKELKAWFINLM